MSSQKIASIAATVLLSLTSLLPIALPDTAHAASPNLIANPSVETATSSQPQAWAKDSWGTNKETYSYVNSGQDGSHSVRVQMTSRSSGDAKWYFTPVNVQAGSKYAFSDYYQSGVQTGVVAQFDDGKGNYTYLDLGSAAKSTAWKQYTATFTVPASAVHVTVFHLIDKVGTLTTDNFSLTAVDSTPVTPPTDPNPPVTPPTNPPAGTNLIDNASVETADTAQNTLPKSWLQDKWGTNKVTYSYLNSGQDGSRSVQVKMTSYTSGDAKWYFKPVAVQQGATYTFSDYYQSGVATDVVVQFDDGKGNDTYLGLGTAPASTSWKQFTATFSPPAGAVNATVFHVINKVGTLTTDNFSLTSSASTTPTDPTPPTNPPSGNVMPNPSVETANAADTTSPQSWHKDSWGTNNPTFTYLTSGQDGSRSLQIQMNSYTDGDAKWDADPVAIPAGTTQYAYSDYYKATVPTMVYAAFTMSDGSTLYQIIGQPSSASNWQQFSTNFSVPAGAVNVTIYHLINRVGTLTTDNFSLSPYTPSGFNRALVSLTFDDGYDSTYAYGLPALQKYGFTSTQYIISGLVGQPHYMTQAQVMAFYNSGNEIGSHTVTHPDLTKDTQAQLTTELGQSQATLQSWTGTPVTNIAYPYGLYNDMVINTAKQYYTFGRGVEDGFNDKTNFSPYDIKVQNIFNTTTTEQVAAWIAQAQASHTWLVLVYHSVDPSANPYAGAEDNVTPAQLDAQLAAIKASGITVETMQQAYNEVKSQL